MAGCTITNTRGYLAKFPPSPLRRACNAVWAIGTLLIILSWFGFVPPLVGWIGFGVAGIGWIVAANLKR
jgi:hypothetical protein